MSLPNNLKRFGNVAVDLNDVKAIVASDADTELARQSAIMLEQGELIEIDRKSALALLDAIA